MERTSDTSSIPTTNLLRVAEYVRMSTEHQQYSTENQRDIIRQYAHRRGMVIVRTYTDAGKSGLRIHGRDALKQLIRDVENGKADFTAILAYDVSRWGRFQDADESAYYEYVCRRANVQVHYCAEPFENDGSPISAIVKSVKRAMAGEYSRELSAKVFIGQCRLIEMGFRQGGAPGIGLRRMLRDANGVYKGVLKRGEQKSIHTDRVILVPGPAEEIEIVRSIYRMFVEEKRSKAKISQILNERGTKTDWGHRWNPSVVNEILTNEKYVGTNVYYKTSFKLKKRFVRNPPDMWIRKNEAFEPIISSELFSKAQTIISERLQKTTNDEMLAQLRTLFEREGRLTRRLIDKTNGMASSYCYEYRFDSLLKAFSLVGYRPERDFRYVAENREVRELRSTFLLDMIERIRLIGAAVVREPSTDVLTVNDEFTASVVVVRSKRWRRDRSYQWWVPIDPSLTSDITIVVRMDTDNLGPLDYYILPKLILPARSLTLRDSNGVSLDIYRHSTLDCFFRMVRRVKTSEAV